MHRSERRYFYFSHNAFFSLCGGHRTRWCPNTRPFIHLFMDRSACQAVVGCQGHGGGQVRGGGWPKGASEVSLSCFRPSGGLAFPPRLTVLRGSSSPRSPAPHRCTVPPATRGSLERQSPFLEGGGRGISRSSDGEYGALILMMKKISNQDSQSNGEGPKGLEQPKISSFKIGTSRVRD